MVTTHSGDNLYSTEELKISRKVSYLPKKSESKISALVDFVIHTFRKLASFKTSILSY